MADAGCIEGSARHSIQKWLLVLSLGTGCTVVEEESLNCSMDRRAGNYLAEFEMLTGDCGPQTPAVVRLDPGAPLAKGCKLAMAEQVSEDECTLTRKTSCPFDSFEPGANVESISVTTQMDETASILTGTTTVTLKRSNGTTVCSGKYRTYAERE